MSQVYLTHPEKEKKQWWNIILIAGFGVFLSFVYLLHVNYVSLNSKELRRQEETKLVLLREIHDYENQIASARSIEEISKTDSIKGLSDVVKSIAIIRTVPQKLAINKDIVKPILSDALTQN